MLIDLGLPKNFWAEVVNTTCFVIKTCLMKSIVNKTSYEVNYLRAFWCKCYVLNNGKDDLGKFDAKSDEGVFMAYLSIRKAYKIYNKRNVYIMCR